MTLDLFARLQTHVAARPDHPALQFLGPEEKEVYTFKAVWDETARLGSHLVEQGMEPGARIGIVMEDGPVWALSFLGILSAGCLAVPFDTQHTPGTLARLIEHAGCCQLLVSPAMRVKLEQVQVSLSKRLPSLLIRPGAGIDSDSDAVWSIRCGSDFPVGPDSQLNPELPQNPVRERAPDDPFAILYTSGTTGDPKGVVLTGRNILRNVDETLKIIQVYRTDHLLSVLPLYHTLALVINLVIPLYAGCTVTFLNVLEPQRIVKAFRDEGITVFVCVPQFFYLLHRRILHEVEQGSWPVRFLFRRLLAVSHLLRNTTGLNPGRRLFFRSVHKSFGPRLRLFGVGGARFDPTIQATLEDLGFRFVQAYGMTETAALITITRLEGNELGSVGRPLSHVQVAIGQPNAEGVGEVLARGDNIMQGYWNNPEATASALDGGWLHTGDSGYMSPRGFLHLTGRTKDVIVLSSGKNVYPEEVEHHYLERCREIKEICVLGVPDPSREGGEKLHAVLVPDFDYLRSRQVVNSADMIRFVIENVSQELPAYKRVHSYEVRREPLPRTTTRKVRRFELAREIQERGMAAGPASKSDILDPEQAERKPETATERAVFAIIRGMKRPEILRREMNLELDLGFDSLERIELLSSLQESFRVQLSDERMSRALTVDDLIELVEDHGEAAGEPDAAISWAEILRRPLGADDERKMHAILTRRPVMEILLFLVARLLAFVSRVLFRLRVEGIENLPEGYPFLICPNHLSYLDVCFLVVALPYRVVRRQFFLGYTNYFESGLLGLIGRRIKVVPVDPDRGLRQALRLSAEGLRRESVLVVFPEGERSIDGSTKTFRKGPSILATELGVRVVPVGIRGTFEVWPRGRARIHLHPVSIEFGAPIEPGVGETVEAFNDRLARERSRAC